MSAPLGQLLAHCTDLPEEALHYLKEKHSIRPATALEWGLRWNPARFTIVVPFNDRQGRHVGSAQRSVRGEKFLEDEAGNSTKWLFDGYGTYVCDMYGSDRHRTEREVFVVEGFFDAIRLWQEGYRPALAVGSCRYLEAHRMYLVEKAETVHLLFDGDVSGRYATILENLRKAPTTRDWRFYMLPKDKDPSDLTNDQLLRLLGPPRCLPTS